MNNHWIFWLTLGSLITLIEIFCFIIFCVFNETFTFHKEYCLFLIPNLLYMIFQFIINYAIITENLNNKEL